MIDSYIKIPDNVGTSFEIVSGRIILGSPQSTFVGLSQSYIGYHIPYFIKNLLGDDTTEWEVGIGKVISTTIIERVLVSSSSNNGDFVIFSFGGTKSFFVYQNEFLSNTAFNNLINSSGIFTVQPIRSTHIVDLSTSAASGLLPSASGNQGLVIDFKASQRNNHNLTIKPSGSELIDGAPYLLIDYNNAFTSVISDGTKWIELKDNVQLNIDSSLVGTPQGTNGSLQYKKSAGVFGGSNLFYDEGSSSLLIGSSTVSDADVVLSQSGNIVLNQKRYNRDLLVYGSGNRNLLFDSSGRLGINLPSGARPQNIIHAIGYSCDTSIKLENRGSCAIPKLTLYHKPSTLLNNNTQISSINLAAKNSAGSETEYAAIKSFAVSTNSINPTGSIVMSVNNGGNELDSLNISPDSIILKNKNKQLTISSSGTISDIFVAESGLSLSYIANSGALLVSDSVGKIQDSGYTVEDLEDIQNKAALSGAVFTGDITVGRVLGPNNTLSDPQMVDLDTLQLVGSWSLNGKNVLSADTDTPANAGYILTHTGSDIEWKELNEDNFIWSGKEISWKKFPNRDCIIQNSADFVSIVGDSLTNEFGIGDIVKINISGINYYRTINQISDSSGYTNIGINNILPSTGNAKIISVSKGGYLDLSVDSLAQPNVSPQTIISCRPGLDTTFNNTKSNIGFKVYGVSNIPSLQIQASGSNSYDNVSPVSINSSGAKIIETINSLNKYASLTIGGYLYTDYLKLGSINVPSGQILVSTSGNIAQWQSTTTINELDGGIIVFSGVNI